MNDDGVFGPWSASRYFTVDTVAPLPPTLVLPVGWASVPATPTFSWLASPTATRYQFEYDESGGNFASPIYTSVELATLTHKPPAMTPGIYTWHVRAKDPAGNWGAWSAVRMIVISPLAPAAPTLTGPANGSIISNSTPTLSWGAL